MVKWLPLLALVLVSACEQAPCEGSMIDSPGGLIVTPVEHPAALATRAPAGAAAAPTVSARCLGAPGAVVGWWYAGTSSPGVQGATIRLVGSVNVRDDYPREENQYSMRSTVLCWLSAGTQQRLSGAPVDIGRGQWWVPVAGGDL